MARKRHRISMKSAAATRSMRAIGIVRLGGRASICGPMGDARETSSRFIFEQLAHEGIETSHIVHMADLVTPISAVMVDPSGERTIVTFRDPKLWRCNCLPSRRCWTIAPPSSPRAVRGILHGSLRRGRPARHSRHCRRRSRDVASRGAAERLLAPGVLERAAAGDRRYRRRCPGAEEDRQADPVVSGRHKGPEGHDLARREQAPFRKRRLSRCTRWTPSAPATSFTAPSRSPSPKSRNCGKRCDSPPPPQR